MAEKIIPFLLDNKEIAVTASAAIPREALYGSLKITREKDGKPLEKVIVTPEGKIFPAKAAAVQRTDQEGTLLEKPEPFTEEGAKAPVHQSSFTQARTLTPCGPEAMIGFKTKSFMAATCDLPPGFYKSTYTFRDSHELADAFLIVKADKEAFLLTGESTNIPMRGKEDPYDFFDNEENPEEGDEEISFEMF
jgi:hypothetical protein